MIDFNLKEIRSAVGGLKIINKETRKHFKAASLEYRRLERVWINLGLQMEKLDELIEINSNILKNHKKFKTVHKLENFKTPLRDFRRDDYARIELIINTDPCVTDDVRLDDWYNFYHELYKLNNPTNDGL